MKKDNSSKMPKQASKSVLILIIIVGLLLLAVVSYFAFQLGMNAA